MDTAWRIIDCSSLEGRITSDRGAICIHQDDGGEHRIPTADVAVILMGPHVSFSTAVVHRLLARMSSCCSATGGVSPRVPPIRGMSMVALGQGSWRNHGSLSRGGRMRGVAW